MIATRIAVRPRRFANPGGASFLDRELP